jgi:hypothetical protein
MFFNTFTAKFKFIQHKYYTARFLPPRPIALGSLLLVRESYKMLDFIMLNGKCIILVTSCITRLQLCLVSYWIEFIMD